MEKAALCVVFLFLLLLREGQCRSLRYNSSQLVTDGIDDLHRSPFLLLKSPEASSVEACEPMYGFLPCTDNIAGHFFLVLVYEVLLFLGEKYVTAGNELMFTWLGPGVFGGSVFHILGALPEAIIVLVSGLSKSREVAQEEIMTGVGFLAGSTVLLMTLLWGTCAICAKHDHRGRNIRKGCFTGPHVFCHSDEDSKPIATIMVLSIIPFIIVQLPNVFHLASGSRFFILLTLIICVEFLLGYFIYEVYKKNNQNRKLNYLKQELLMSEVMKHVHKDIESRLQECRKEAKDKLKEVLQEQEDLVKRQHEHNEWLEKLVKLTDIKSRLVTHDGFTDNNSIKWIFNHLDEDGDRVITKKEIQKLLQGVEENLEHLHSEPKEAIEIIMKDFDKDGDDKINLEEFSQGLKKWLSIAQKAVVDPANIDKKVWEDYKMSLTVTRKLEEINLLDYLWIGCKAVLLLLLGIVILALFADPLVDAVQNFSNAVRIPSFFVSFILLPLATNFREALSAIDSACHKTKTSSSLSFSEIYGGVIMNNVLGLTIILSIIYIRGLTWDFSAEVLVILIVCAVMGLLIHWYPTLPLWTSLVAILMYPLSLLLVYVLDYVLGWS